MRIRLTPLSRWLILALLLIVVPDAVAQRPRVGLVLSGGGAKGAATIGALTYIEEEIGLRFDCVAGTSIGAVIGGLYAAGLSTKQLETRFLALDITSLKSGDELERYISRLLSERNVRTFADAPTPFCCVAADIHSGREVVLSRGLLSRAIRASMSLPVLFDPVMLDGRTLTDGGVVNNFPVNVMRQQMGADIIVAIDLQQSSDDAQQMSVEELYGIYRDWLHRDTAKRNHKANVLDADIYIHIDTKGFNALSFGRGSTRQMLEKGRSEARKHRQELLDLKQLLDTY